MEEDDEVLQLVSVLKSQIFVEETLSEDYEDILRELFTLLNENKSILRHLERSNFIVDTLLLILRYDQAYDLGLQFITEMISMGGRIPEYFYSKNFVFFITEKLYEQMDDSSTNIELVTALIKKERVFINIFEECGYFVLVNSLINEQSCKLYSQIFCGYEERANTKADQCVRSKKNDKNQISINEDVMFEIHRKNFDSEIVFRESGVMKFKLRSPTFKEGNCLLDRLFNKLYETNLYKLLDLSVCDIVNVLSYKAVKCDWLLDDSAFLDLLYSGDIAALRVLRNIIKDCEENGLTKLEENGYLTKIIRLLDKKCRKIRFETIMGICNYLNRVQPTSLKVFNEKRIRIIFSLLEYSCENCSCCYKYCSLKSETESDSSIAENIHNSFTFMQDNIPNPNNDELENHSLNMTIESFSYRETMPSMGMSDFTSTLFPTDLSQPQFNQEPNLSCLKNCDSMKILDLLFKIFTNHNKEYFYKISYMIILRSINESLYYHNCFNKDVFNYLFSEFITFLISRKNNFSRILFTFQNHKEEKIPLEEESKHDVYE